MGTCGTGGGLGDLIASSNLTITRNGNSNSIFERERIDNTTTQGTDPDFTFDQVIGTNPKNLNVDPDVVFNVALNGVGPAGFCPLFT